MKAPIFLEVVLETEIKQSKLSFSSIETKKQLPVSIQCLVGQIQVQNPFIVVATDQMPHHTQRKE